MSETKFEVGKKYRTKGGGWRFIESIDDNEYLPINALDEDGDGGWYYPLGGEYTCGYSDQYDILLPAIEEPEPTVECNQIPGDQCAGCDLMDEIFRDPPAIEPAKEGFSIPTLNALTEYQGFWKTFRARVEDGTVNPVNSDPRADPDFWPIREGSAFIECSYPTREAALSEAAAVIADLGALLEGRAGL
ncbi:MAG: hypothetical protein EOP87_00035 [Verrucomicrobiaceae bacterium]|nr:MAG: hypothetical protein EOP87_00035 [Verrucomicrobiaceae bacterium]